MCLRNRLVALAAGLLLLPSAFGVTVSVTQAKQRYPWNGIVDIDYAIALGPGESLASPDVRLEFFVADESVTPVVTNRLSAILPAPLPVSAGSHRLSWNATADGVSFVSSKAVFMAQVVRYPETYMIVDISNSSAYKVTYLSGRPAHGFKTDEYRGTKIALRRICPGSYMAGSPSTEVGRSTVAGVEDQHPVVITKPFYIGIFPMTQKQYETVMGNLLTSTTKSQYKGDYRPAENVGYYTLRGSSQGTTWPASGEVDANSFFYLMRTRCKEQNPETGNWDVAVEGFDLPTEFQWEYACRVGTDTPFNNGVACGTSAQDEETELKKLGRYTGDKDDGAGNPEYLETTVVGSYTPNAWGLYDMHGNVYEWCLDRWIGDVKGLGQVVDPKGTTRISGGYYDGAFVVRGGHWDSAVGNCRSAARYRVFGSPSDGRFEKVVGFRLACTLR